MFTQSRYFRYDTAPKRWGRLQGFTRRYRADYYNRWQRFERYQRIFILTLLVGGALIGGVALAKGTLTTNTERGAQHLPTPLQGKRLYVDPNSNAARQAGAWRTTRPADAAAMDKLAAQATAKWIVGDRYIDSLREYVAAAKSQDAIPVTVAYYIPDRDCGLYSAGGAANASAYRSFIDKYAQAVGTAPAIVILEPDAVPQTKNDGHQHKCLDANALNTRTDLLRYAVTTLKKNSNTVVYLDAGNSAWIADTADLANRLKAAGVEHADGFSLNVSNFQTTKNTTIYGKKVSQSLGGKHFVIDTSRNGLGPFTNTARPDFSWCNPPNRALGHYPTLTTRDPLVDAYLYIKSPGESDGADAGDPLKCFSGPAAGTWWPDYALGLVQRWPTSLQSSK